MLISKQELYNIARDTIANYLEQKSVKRYAICDRCLIDKSIKNLVAFEGEYKSGDMFLFFLKGVSCDSENNVCIYVEKYVQNRNTNSIIDDSFVLEGTIKTNNKL